MALIQLNPGVVYFYGFLEAVKDEFDLNVFLNVINDLHPAIQFTHEKDKRALSFLD